MNMVKKIFLYIAAAAAAAAMSLSFAGCEKKGGENETSEYNFSYNDALTAFDAFMDGFFEARGQFARDTDKSGVTAVAWTQATMFDMILNAYTLSGDEKYLRQLKTHFEGCKNSFTFDWYDYSHWDLYDDMMWWVGSLARAYQVTGEKEYLEISEEGFERVWYGKESNFDGTGWSALDGLGCYGGDDPAEDIEYVHNGQTKIYRPERVKAMYWDWKFERTGKMSCIHFPTMVAAIELYHCTGNEDYLNKAKDLYPYGSTKLFNAKTGEVADSMHGENSGADWTTLVYNQATAMAAFAMLYLETKEQVYLDNAKAAMDYIVNKKSTANKILKPEGDVNQSSLTDEKGIYNAILATYIPLIIEECGQTQYTEFIERSIEYGWNNRDSRNLTNKFLEKRLNASQSVSAYTASGVPALMLTFPGIKDRK